jgi:putative addiction module component (TIGR02574 family)
MTDVALRLKDEILRLCEDDREELLRLLHDSLEEDKDEGYDEAWEAELDRRFAEIESGKAVGRLARDFIEELRKKYS